MKAKQLDTTAFDNSADQPFYKLGRSSAEETGPEIHYRHQPKKIHSVFHWPEETFDTISQQWLGVVESLNGDEYTVKLKDVQDKRAPEEIAILPVDSLPENEKRHLYIGASLVWTIGQKGRENEMFSKIIFRSLPKWSQESVNEAVKWGKEAFEKINNSDNTATF